MTELKELLTQAVNNTDNDTDLANQLIESGALAAIVRLGTYEEETVQKRLKYSSDAALRAALSKARRNKGTFPLPVLEGRRWSRQSVDDYRKAQQS